MTVLIANDELNSPQPATAGWFDVWTYSDQACSLLVVGWLFALLVAGLTCVSLGRRGRHGRLARAFAVAWIGVLVGIALSLWAASA
ncbi:MAG: hypothetical protein R3C15_19670 [Thermoleophilia bacterium]